MSLKTSESARGLLLATMTLGSVACAHSQPAPASPPHRPPNIVLILVDDLGWTDLGCYGSRYYETPNLDRLAEQGMRFTNAYAACAVCSPTRAAVMTGRYPARLGVTDWIRASFQGSTVPPDRKNPTEYIGGPKRRLLCPPNALWMESEERTIAEILDDAGYATCHIGKWHLGFEDWYPNRQGFDINIGGCDYGHPPSYFDPYCNQKHCIPTIEPRREGEYLTDREADEAATFIASHKDEPFFLYWAPYAVHTPIQAPEDLTEKYRNKSATNQKNPKYAAMVDSVDRGVGRILDALDKLELADHTLIIFTSDNGGLLGPTDNAPLRSGKGFPYEGGIRVPFMVRGPGVAVAATSDTPVCSIDLLPTICRATGLRTPDDRRIDGSDITPLLTGSGTLSRECLIWHFPHYRYNDVGPYSIIRFGDWKLIKHYDDGRFELFNLAEDPSETQNLAPEMLPQVRGMDTMLMTRLEGMGAKLPRENPEYDPEQ